MENDNLCLMGGAVNKLELKFTETVPRSVTWYNHYYMDAETRIFIYPSLQQKNTVENIDATVILPIGGNLVAPLESSTKGREMFRIIRIVCEFDDQMIEYYIFF